jgi:prepilin-type N-terminal cleavage/methylation domain-containing protein
MSQLNKLVLNSSNSTNSVFAPAVRCSVAFRRFKIRNGNGFTLIELLVVIATIAVLLAILMPALRRAKALAQGVVCRANLRQIATAWNMYLDDNDGYFYQGANANLNYGGWQGIQAWSPRPLNQYLGLSGTLETEDSAKVFRCPADRGGVPGYARHEKVFRYLGTSYQTNIFLIGQNRCGTFSAKTADLDKEISARLGKLNRSQVGNPARILLIGDYGWINQWQPQRHPLSLTNEKYLAEWHGRVDCYNMAFLDSHAKLLNIRKGFYVTDEYSVLPFEELYDLAHEVQGYEP